MTMSSTAPTQQRPHVSWGVGSGRSGRERWHTELRRLAKHASGKTVERVEELAAHVAEQRDLVVVHRHCVAHECEDHAHVADEVGHEEVDRDHGGAVVASKGLSDGAKVSLGGA